MTSTALSSPLVSIVLPTYNRASMLDKALATCLSQTLSNLEVVVVDDGSPDQTQKVVREWQAKDERVLLVTQANAGLPAALNAGFKAARGQYLTWTSDDNAFHADALEIMVQALEDDASVDFVYCDYLAIDENDKVIERVSLPDSDNLATKNVVGACFLYRRRVYESVGDYDTALFLAEDYDYWLRVSKRFRMKHLDACPYNYRLHATSLTSKREFAIFKMTLRARLKNSSDFGHRVLILRQAALHWRRRYLPLRAMLRRIRSKR